MPTDNVARQHALAGGYYVADFDGAVKRSGIDRMDDWLSVKDFGAVGDGVTDDTTAIRSAIRALAERKASLFDGYRLGTGVIYFPEGVYRITSSGILSGLNANPTKRSSIVLKGAGWRNSILWLDPAALSSETWFYDNGSTQTQWGMVCEDLCFSGGTDWRDANPSTDVGKGLGNISSYCNGFKISGPGWESGFVFSRCEFRFLQTVYHAAGSNNADTHRFMACAVNRCNNVNYINNNQAFSVNWIGCYVNNIYGNFLEYGPNVASPNAGGGNFLMLGGAIIALAGTGDTSTHYVVKATSGGTSTANVPITFRDVRMELRGNYHGFANVTHAETVVTADGCTFYTDSTVDKNLVTVDGYCSVIFKGGAIDNGDGGGAFEFVIAGTAGRYGKNALLMFTDGIILPPKISEYAASSISHTGNGGRLIIDRSCRIGNVTDPVSQPRVYAHACDITGPSTLTGGGVAANTKNRAGHRITVNPFYTQTQLTGATGVTGTVVRLPPNVTLIEVWAKIEAGQGNGSNIRILCGNSDKTVVYGSTTVGAQNAGQLLSVRDIYRFLGTDLNERDVRFWFDDGAGGNSAASATGLITGGVVYE